MIIVQHISVDITIREPSKDRMSSGEQMHGEAMLKGPFVPDCS